MSKKSEMLNNFNAYNDGNKLIGCTSEFSLPDIETMTETISALGLLGEVEVPAIGHISAMEMEIPFLNLADDIFKLFNPVSGVSLTLRGSMQCVNPSTQAKSFTAVRIVVKGSCKKITGGSFKPGSPGNPSVTTTVNYLLVEYDGKKKLEIDKLNGVFKVNDKNILSSITKQC
jgi:hypothetical protein